MFKGKSTQIFQADQFPLSECNLYQIADCSFLVAGSYFTTEGNWPTSKMSTKSAQLLSKLLNLEKFNFNQNIDIADILKTRFFFQILIITRTEEDISHFARVGIIFK